MDSQGVPPCGADAGREILLRPGALTGRGPGRSGRCAGRQRRASSRTVAFSEVQSTSEVQSRKIQRISMVPSISKAPSTSEVPRTARSVPAASQGTTDTPWEGEGAAAPGRAEQGGGGGGAGWRGVSSCPPSVKPHRSGVRLGSRNGEGGGPTMLHARVGAIRRLATRISGPVDSLSCSGAVRQRLLSI